MHVALLHPECAGTGGRLRGGGGRGTEGCQLGSHEEAPPHLCLQLVSLLRQLEGLGDEGEGQRGQLRLEGEAARAGEVVHPLVRL